MNTSEFTTRLFTDNDKSECEKMFNTLHTTKEVQEYLMKLYKVPRSRTSNFIKKVRRDMGIYRSLK